MDTQHDITSLSASGMTITLGLGDNLNVSTMGMAGTGVIDMTSSSDFTNTAYTGGTTNTLTVNHAGGGDVNFSSLTVGNGFTYNGTGLTTGSTFSAVTINTSQTGGVVFNYGKVLGHLSQPQLSRQLVCLRLMEQILLLQKLPSLRLLQVVP